MGDNSGYADFGNEIRVKVDHATTSNGDGDQTKFTHGSLQANESSPPYQKCLSHSGKHQSLQKSLLKKVTTPRRVSEQEAGLANSQNSNWH